MAICRHSEAFFSGKTEWMRPSVRRRWNPQAKANRASPRASAQARLYGTALTTAHALRSAAYSHQQANLDFFFRDMQASIIPYRAALGYGIIVAP